MSKSKFIKHIPCDACGSSDANSLYSDGHQYCSVCKAYVPGEGDGKEIDQPFTKMRAIPDAFEAIKERGIAKQAVERFKVSRLPDGGHVYPYFNTAGQHIANKVRKGGPKTKDSFFWEGDPKQATMFGQDTFNAGCAKSITLVEGECDAMAAYEMTGSRWPVVSVHSSGAAPKNVADNFEYLNSFENIVICFDKDDAKVNEKTGEVRYPGQEAALAVAAMFPIGKVKILTLRDYKDANDYLVNGKGSQFVQEWFQAVPYTPTGLKLGRDMWDEISTPKNYETCPYPWAGLNAKTYGIRLSELVIVTAETGVGKTSFLKEIEHFLLKNTDKGLGLLHLEEPNSDTALGLMSIDANKPLHLPDVREHVSNDELRGYFDATVNSERVVIWDHFGSNSIHEVLAKIRHMHNLGCKYIVLDHLSIVVSDQSGDERKQLDEISTKLKTLCMELNIAVIAIIHQNRQGQIRGTAGVEQLANIVVKLFREKEDPDEWRRNVTKVVIQKNRFSGITGPGVYLWYCPLTGRLMELSDEEIKLYETGSSPPESEQW